RELPLSGLPVIDHEAGNFRAVPEQAAAANFGIDARDALHRRPRLQETQRLEQRLGPLLAFRQSGNPVEDLQGVQDAAARRGFLAAERVLQAAGAGAYLRLQLAVLHMTGNVD